MMDNTAMNDAGPPAHARDWKQGIARGLARRCPACGEGRLFARYLKVAPVCASCGQALHHHRADVLPPYLTIVVVAKFVGLGIYVSEMYYEPSLAFHLATWPALTLVLCLTLLPPLKGAVVGLQYALGMHGFGAGGDNDAEKPRETSEGPRT
ncbi:MAG: DUF983 domain-containing protein [Salinarimonadaceae bacterium]|nr:MAG: DUF983 domain-containing protein [Salinarimonadaceae bacterium]